MFIVPCQKNNSQHSSSNVEDGDEKYKEDEENMTADSLVTNQKRKRVCPSRFQMAKVQTCKKQRQGGSDRKAKPKELKHSTNRWPAERYKRAEQSMLDIMKTEGAVFGNPILRQTLRLVARRYIRDTGLLDHLLKHMDGKLAPGGAERFRRWHNPDGVMEYWLENADLDNIRREAGVQDPYWTPQPQQHPGGNSSEDPDLSEELKLLRAEMAKLKREVQELMSKKLAEAQANLIHLSSVVIEDVKFDGSPLSLQEMREDLLSWKASTEQRLMEISNSLSGMQNIYEDVEKWKAKIEHQLMEISNSLTNIQQDGVAPWMQSGDAVNFQEEDLNSWLENADLNIRDEDLAHWLETDELINIEHEVVQDPCLVPPPEQKPIISPSQGPISTRVLGPFKEDLAKMKRDVQELAAVVPKKEVEDEVNAFANASVNTNLKLDRTSLPLQEMYLDFKRWKTNIEQQLMEMSNSLSNFQAPKQIIF